EQPGAHDDAEEHRDAVPAGHQDAERRDCQEHHREGSPDEGTGNTAAAGYQEPDDRADHGDGAGEQGPIQEHLLQDGGGGPSVSSRLRLVIGDTVNQALMMKPIAMKPNATLLCTTGTKTNSRVPIAKTAVQL